MDGMGRLEFTTPRAAWGGEATAFTPLLAQEDILDYLGRETGIGPLALVEVEHATLMVIADELEELANDGGVSWQAVYP
jgi:hypothetical protein